MLISIQIDFRENPSGIPELLAKNTAVSVSVSSLFSGDYIINKAIGIERKSREDFVQSLVSGRLFSQVAKLKRSFPRPLLVIEGDPYNSAYDIHEEAVRGALLSVAVSWQLPVLFSKDPQDTAGIILMIAQQDISIPVTGVRPEHFRQSRKSCRQLSLLQALPGVGPELAVRLLKKMGSLKTVINATERELREVEGIGENKAEKIHAFINTICHEGST